MFLLEDRVLFDGAGATDIAEGNNEHDANENFDNNGESHDTETDETNISNPGTPDHSEAIDTDLGAPSISDPVTLEIPDVKILLISDSLGEHDAAILANAAENVHGVKVIRFDPNTCTSSQLLAEIQQNLENGQKISSIGIAAETDKSGFLTLLENDSDTQFWRGLSQDYLAEDGRVDLFASKAADSQLVNSLEDILSDNQQVCSSSTVIGSSDDPTDNANWFLEDGNIDLTTEYFDSKLPGKAESQEIIFETTSDSPGKVLVIVSDSVTDLDHILDDINEDFEILTLDRDSDPFEQINKHLMDNSTDGEYGGTSFC